MAAKKTEYYDPTGAKQTGYLIDGQTYKDEGGTQRIDVGSVVLGDKGKAWQLTENGGVRVNPAMTQQAAAGSAPAWLQEAQTILQQINGGQKFDGNLNGDALMQQYTDLYTRNGQRAMQDTMGQAAALTGGYGSSYAQSAGQQAYNEWMDRLGDKALDIYQIRRNEYDKDQAALYDRLSAVSGMYDRAYAAEQDALANARTEDEIAHQRAREAISDERYDDETAYGHSRDTVADERYADETAYERQSDMYKQVSSMIESGYMPSDDELAAAGMSKGYAQYRVAQVQQALAAQASGGGGGPYRDTGDQPADPGSVKLTAVPASLINQLYAAYSASGGSDAAIAATMADLQKAGYDTDAAYTQIVSRYIQKQREEKGLPNNNRLLKNTNQIK